MDRQTDRRTDGQTDTGPWLVPLMHHRAVKTTLAVTMPLPTVYCGLGIVMPRKMSLFEKISICLGSSSPATQIHSSRVNTSVRQPKTTRLNHLFKNQHNTLRREKHRTHLNACVTNSSRVFVTTISCDKRTAYFHVSNASQ